MRQGVEVAGPGHHLIDRHRHVVLLLDLIRDESRGSQDRQCETEGFGRFVVREFRCHPLKEVVPCLEGNFGKPVDLITIEAHVTRHRCVPTLAAMLP